METISYGASVMAGKSSVTTITTSELDLLLVTDLKYVKKSQLTAFFNIALGAATNVKIRYYASPDGNKTWIPIPVKNLGTGELADIPSLIDSGTYLSGSNSLALEDIPVPACMGFKITGQATGASATLNLLELLVRDN